VAEGDRRFGPDQDAVPTVEGHARPSAERMAEPVMAPGTWLGDRYRIEELLGSGGMGHVYRATDLELDRSVALKTVRVPSAHALVRLRREVLLASRVTHANVIRLHDLVTMDGISFVTMELVAGQSLKSRIAAGDVTIAEAVDIARQCADGLHAAHEAGVIHRDFKPENVLLETGGRAVVVDFGVAGELIEGVTQASAIVGTTAYMSPEQANGQAPSPQTDLYALGLVLHEMLTGEIPLLGRGPVDTAMLRCFQAPPSVRDRRPDVPEALAALILRMLAIDPAARPPSAAAVAAELLAPPAEVAAEAPPPPARRRRSPLLLLVPFVLAAAVVAAIVVLTGSGSSDDEDAAEPEAQPVAAPGPPPDAAPPPVNLAMARRYRVGDGVMKDPPKAWAMYEAACEQKNGDACSFAGWMAYFGEGIPVDQAGAAKRFEQGCALLSQAACSNLGMALYRGGGVAADPLRAVKLFTDACQFSEGGACLNLAGAYLAGRGVPADPVRARSLLKRACDLEHGMGCDNYGVVLADGIGGPADPAAAAAAWDLACNTYYAERGCENLAFAYDEGKGVPADAAKATILFQQGCVGGSMRACRFAGYRLLMGKGIETDLAGGNQFLEKACDGGDAQACWDFGGQYEHGIGVTKDAARAADLRQKACQLDPKLAACR
jgi:TPR repeat protein